VSSEPGAGQWRDNLGPNYAKNLDYLDKADLTLLRKSCGESDLKHIEEALIPLVDAARSAAKDAPADVQELTTDKKVAETALSIFDSKKKSEFVAMVGILKTFISGIEAEIRKEIAEQSEAVIKAISGDIQEMWKILHPGEHIEDVRLHVPEDTEKAIDICLKFHGVDQDSPRLTLSEGFRNSLGLCIFLAMAKREAATDQPIFLDDVVVSVDRNHRGMIVELLEKILHDRQLILFTHDRDWFIELKQQLNSENWSYKALMPYESPAMGIRWSEKTFGFDDARKLAVTDPDLAGNTARKIMDIELAIRAERLKIRLPYLHRERNDHRGAHEFLEQIIADSELCFQKKEGNDYKKNVEGIEVLRQADKLLVSWANKASHSQNVTKAEAIKLIDACEKALASLDCAICKKSIHKLDDAKAEFVQCGCGAIRWRYGKS
jgi:AAA domain